MRKALIILALLFAAFAPLVRYHPDAAAPLPSPPAVAAPPSPGESPGGTRTVNGPIVDTEFGPYQVRVTFSGATITDVRLITEPDDGHSRRIASFAEPTLRSEALAAQSAHIDMVSGATATSEAYTRSLQAAIDANGG